MSTLTLTLMWGFGEVEQVGVEGTGSWVSPWLGSSLTKISKWWTPKSRNGPIEQMRVLMVARSSAREQRIQSHNQLRHLVFTALDEIRVRFKDRYKTGLVTEAANMRPRKGSDPITFTTYLVIRNLARRVNVHF